MTKPCECRLCVRGRSWGERKSSPDIEEVRLLAQEVWDLLEHTELDLEVLKCKVSGNWNNPRDFALEVTRACGVYE